MAPTPAALPRSLFIAVTLLAGLVLPVTMVDEAAAQGTACGQATLTASERAVRSGGRLTVSGSCVTAGSSAAQSPTAATIQIRTKRGWRRVARPQVGPDGRFSTALRVRVSRRTKVASLRAAASTPASVARVGVFPACKRDPKCKRRYGGNTRPRGLLGSDTGANPEPSSFWGRIDCQNASRHQLIPSGGDPSPTATGEAQGNASYRRLTVLDGDDYWGERCELGENSHRGKVAFYREGQRRLTYASFRLPESFPTDSENWQGVLQMKQAQPSDNGGGAPVISLGVFQGEWSLWTSVPGYSDNDRKLFSAPARNGVWTRVAFDVKYSRVPSKGRLKVSIDTNGDGDFEEAGEQSAVFRVNTLKVELAGDNRDGVKKGKSIPSHLRAGIYHHSAIECPPPAGCSVDLDNVQVIAP